MAEVDDDVEGAAEVVFDSETLEAVLAAIHVSQGPNTPIPNDTEPWIRDRLTATGGNEGVVGRHNTGGGRWARDAAAG